MSNFYSLTEQSTEPEPTIVPSRKVQFGRTETIFFNVVDDEDIGLRWCTREDDLKFRRQWVRDVGILARVMRLSSSAKADLTKCVWKFVGLESFTSPAMARLVAESKRQHIDAVLTEQNQRRQRAHRGTNCDYDETELLLAVVSKHSSEWARNRAYQIAVEYSLM
mmetsp:Transcript_29768/g.59569  ORF Transcript_29768/g.59569 Transcript_29768/m.59569 type:complete len:165 (+) Transcript_29768:163-657(+)